MERKVDRGMLMEGYLLRMSRMDMRCWSISASYLSPARLWISALVSSLPEKFTSLLRLVRLTVWDSSTRVLKRLEARMGVPVGRKVGRCDDTVKTVSSSTPKQVMTRSTS
jgi:hypothetical protein